MDVMDLLRILVYVKGIYDDSTQYLSFEKRFTISPFPMSFTLKRHNFNEVRCVVSKVIYVVAINYY